LPAAFFLLYFSQYVFHLLPVFGQKMWLPKSTSREGTRVSDTRSATTIESPSMSPIVCTMEYVAVDIARNAMMTVAPLVIIDSPAQHTAVCTASSFVAPLIRSSLYLVIRKME